MRALLLSDVHANLTALEAVLADAPAHDALWVTGDTVGYGPDPSDVLALLRERGAVLVAGNHDRAVATGEGVRAFNGIAAAAVKAHRGWLSAEERDALAALPLVHRAEGFTLVHGSVRDPLWEYVLDGGAALASLRLAETDHCCNGHTHLPAVFRLEGERLALARPAHGEAVPLSGRVMANPGSVGQPRDGDPRSAYAVVDTDAGTLTFFRASYDIDETRRRIAARGLPALLAERLTHGW